MEKYFVVGYLEGTLCGNFPIKPTSSYIHGDKVPLSNPSFNVTELDDSIKIGHSIASIASKSAMVSIE